jgi:hypothetical protein
MPRELEQILDKLVKGQDITKADLKVLKKYLN